MRKHNAILLGALMLSLGAISAPANSVEMIYGGFSKHIGVHEYEKVQIPGFQEAIRKIKRFLEDEENLSKSSQKIVKTRKLMEE